MALLLRRSRWLLLAIVFIVTTFSLFGHVSPKFQKPAQESYREPTEEQTYVTPTRPEDEVWEFDSKRDSLNYGLSDDQCKVSEYA